MILALASGRAVRFREPPPAAVVRWDLMRPTTSRAPAPLPKPPRLAVPQPVPALVRNKVGLAIRAAADISGVSVAEIVGPRRLGPIVVARKLAFFIARRTSTRSLPSIGEHVGRDHSTVFHGLRCIEAAIVKLGLDPEKPPLDLAAELWERREEWK